MKLLKLVPDKTNIQFINKRLIAFALSAFLTLGSLGLFFGQGLNLGSEQRGMPTAANHQVALLHNKV